MDTDSLIAQVETEYIYKDFAEDAGKICNSSNSELGRALLERKKKKSNWINER